MEGGGGGVKKKPKPTNITTTTIIGRRKKPLDNIPVEIVHDILKRLPVKSLLLCKAVCKSWRGLISDPRFVKSHLDLAIKKWDNVIYCHLNQVLGARCQSQSASLFFINYKASEVKTLTYDISFVMNHVRYYHYNFKIPPTQVLFEVLGSCNGLLLIGCRYYMSLTLLWNPSTGECSRLATAAKHSQMLEDQCYISALAYDTSVDEYKAVVLKKKYDGVPRMFVCSTSKTVFWKEVNVMVHEFPYGLNYSRDRCGITVNGAPHWVVDDSRSDSLSLGKRIIIYFDTVEEKFKKLPTPSWNQICHNIALLGGCLCTILSDISKPGRPHAAFEVWALKEYGVKESWTKLFVIRMPSSAARTLMPLGFTMDGDEVVVVINKSKLMTYNLNTREARNVVPTTHFLVNGVLYVESLVSPKRIEKRKEMPTRSHSRKKGR